MPSRVLTEEEVGLRLAQAWVDEATLSEEAQIEIRAWWDVLGPHHEFPAALRAVGVTWDGTHYREVGDG